MQVGSVLFDGINGCFLESIGCVVVMKRRHDSDDDKPPGVRACLDLTIVNSQIGTRRTIRDTVDV